MIVVSRAHFETLEIPNGWLLCAWKCSNLQRIQLDSTRGFKCHASWPRPRGSTGMISTGGRFQPFPAATIRLSVSRGDPMGRGAFQEPRDLLTKPGCGNVSTSVRGRKGFGLTGGVAIPRAHGQHEVGPCQCIQADQVVGFVSLQIPFAVNPGNRATPAVADRQATHARGLDPRSEQWPSWQKRQERHVLQYQDFPSRGLSYEAPQ